ncbi:hypothetical protein Tco_1247382 [Tanacetum coccineum]
MGTTLRKFIDARKRRSNQLGLNDLVFIGTVTSEIGRYNADIRATNIILQEHEGQGIQCTWSRELVGYGRAQNRVGNANPGQARQLREWGNLVERAVIVPSGGMDNFNIDEDVDEQPVQD